PAAAGAAAGTAAAPGGATRAPGVRVGGSPGAGGGAGRGGGGGGGPGGAPGPRRGLPAPGRRGRGGGAGPARPPPRAPAWRRAGRQLVPRGVVGLWGLAAEDAAAESLVVLADALAEHGGAAAAPGCSILAVSRRLHALSGERPRPAPGALLGACAAIARRH